MQKTSLVSYIKSYLAASIAISAAVAQIAAIYDVIRIESLWVIILWAIVIVAILIMIGQTARAEGKIKKCTDLLATSKERLTNEIKHRFWAEKTISENKVRLQFIDENIPVMLAYFSTEQRCRYHNRIFRRWFGLKPEQIDGQLLKKFSNEVFFSGIEDCIETAITTGKTVHNERVIKSEKGVPYNFTEQFIPHLDSRKEVIGFYTLQTPRAQDKSIASSKNNVTSKIPEPESTKASNNSESTQSGISATRIAKAIDDGEFHLFSQEIMPVKIGSEPTHHEILIRMAEEENNLIPPGAFLPFVEKYKMMPRLDRWVVHYMAQWLAAHHVMPDSVFCINVAKDTLCDTDFPNFVHDQIQTTKIPATKLCFEIEELDAELEPTSALIFAEKISKLGCRISLCSFSHSRTSLDLLKKTKINYVKIDGSLVCNMLREPDDLNKVIAINQIAHIKGVQTIAELVETDEITTKLGEIGVDFAQGFGIAKPHPLKDLE